MNRFFGMMILFLGLCACATAPGEMQTPRWSCDDQADAAVDQDRLEEALTRHQAVVAADPANCLALYHLGYIRGRLGDRNNEIAGYEKAVACGYDQDDQLFFNMGMAYGDLGKPDKAAAYFKRAVALNPKNSDNYFGLGLASRLAGDSDQAFLAFSKAVAVDPRNWDARIELARLLLDQARLEEARAQLQAVDQGAPGHAALDDLWRIYHDRKITIYERTP